MGWVAQDGVMAWGLGSGGSGCWGVPGVGAGMGMGFEHGGMGVGWGLGISIGHSLTLT